MGSKVDDRDFTALLPELTLEEKIALLSGCDFSTAAGVARLNIPPTKVSLPRDPTRKPGAEAKEEADMETSINS